MHILIALACTETKVWINKRYTSTDSIIVSCVCSKHFVSYGRLHYIYDAVEIQLIVIVLSHVLHPHRVVQGKHYTFMVLPVHGKQIEPNSQFWLCDMVNCLRACNLFAVCSISYCSNCLTLWLLRKRLTFNLPLFSERSNKSGFEEWAKQLVLLTRVQFSIPAPTTIIFVLASMLAECNHSAL